MVKTIKAIAAGAMRGQRKECVKTDEIRAVIPFT